LPAALLTPATEPLDCQHTHAPTSAESDPAMSIEAAVKMYDKRVDEASTEEMLYSAELGKIAEAVAEECGVSLDDLAERLNDRAEFAG
jgi:hypothetical protein